MQVLFWGIGDIYQNEKSGSDDQWMHSPASRVLGLSPGQPLRVPKATSPQPPARTPQTPSTITSAEDLLSTPYRSDWDAVALEHSARCFLRKSH